MVFRIFDMAGSLCWSPLCRFSPRGGCGLSWAVLTTWWLDLAYAPHLRQKAGGVCSPLMRRGVFSVSFAPWGAPREEFLDMCDYSLHSVRTRPAKVGEKLVTHNFGTGTRGFAAPEDCSVAVCVLPGTELAFETPVKY